MTIFPIAIWKCPSCNAADACVLHKAAPELLNALKDCAALCEGLSSLEGLKGQVVRAMQKDLVALIAKAEGR
jgi:hypothetical protein